MDQQGRSGGCSVYFAWAACLPASVSHGYCRAPLHGHPRLAFMQSIAMFKSLTLAVCQPHCTILGYTPYMWALTPTKMLRVLGHMLPDIAR